MYVILDISNRILDFFWEFPWEQIASSATTHRQKSQVFSLPLQMENLRHVLQLFIVWS